MVESNILKQSCKLKGKPKNKRGPPPLKRRPSRRYTTHRDRIRSSVSEWTEGKKRSLDHLPEHREYLSLQSSGQLDHSRGEGGETSCRVWKQVNTLVLVVVRNEVNGSRVNPVNTNNERFMISFLFVCVSFSYVSSFCRRSVPTHYISQGGGRLPGPRF